MLESELHGEARIGVGADIISGHLEQVGLAGCQRPFLLYTYRNLYWTYYSWAIHWLTLEIESKKDTPVSFYIKVPSDDPHPCDGIKRQRCRHQVNSGLLTTTYNYKTTTTNTNITAKPKLNTKNNSCFNLPDSTYQRTQTPINRQYEDPLHRRTSNHCPTNIKPAADRIIDTQKRVQASNRAGCWEGIEHIFALYSGQVRYTSLIYRVCQTGVAGGMADARGSKARPNNRADIIPIVSGSSWQFSARQ